MAQGTRPLALVTGASTGIGYELAQICARNGFDLVVAADEPEIEDAARDLRKLGATAEAIQADLATLEGVDKLYAVAKGMGRPVDALLANAGRGLGKGFLDQNFGDVMRVINTNITGTLHLLQKVGRDMRGRRSGRILIVGSIAGFMPGTYQAVYNGTKAFLDSFSFALRHEIKDSGVTVTCLMPGATETDFFERADMLDTKIGQSKKDDPADVARQGFDAVMRGEGTSLPGGTTNCVRRSRWSLPRTCSPSSIGGRRSREAPLDNVIAEAAPPRDKMPALRTVDIHEGVADEPGGF